jgi:LysM repeat protein
VPPAPILQPAPEPVIPAPTPKPPPELVTPAPTPKPAPEPIFPPPGPAPSPTPVPRIPTPAPTTIYVIEPGDTLGKIATRFGTTIAAIIATNRIVNPNLIRAGTKLMIPVAPPEVPPTMPEEMPIMPTPPAPRPPAPPPPPPGPRGVQVDPRLNALGVRVESADVAPGQVYWKLIRAVYQDPDESSGNHNVFYKVVDENNHPIANHKVLQAWPSDQTDATTKPDGTCDIALWASFAPDRGERGPYSAWVDGAPSDKVTGMGLPLSRNVNFLLTWQRAKK